MHQDSRLYPEEYLVFVSLLFQPLVHIFCIAFAALFFSHIAAPPTLWIICPSLMLHVTILKLYLHVHTPALHCTISVSYFLFLHFNTNYHGTNLQSMRGVPSRSFYDMNYAGEGHWELHLTIASPQSKGHLVKSSRVWLMLLVQEKHASNGWQSVEDRLLEDDIIMGIIASCSGYRVKWRTISNTHNAAHRKATGHASTNRRMSHSSEKIGFDAIFIR